MGKAKNKRIKRLLEDKALGLASLKYSVYNPSGEMHPDERVPWEPWHKRWERMFGVIPDMQEKKNTQNSGASDSLTRSMEREGKKDGRYTRWNS